MANTHWDVHVFGIQNTIHPLFCAENITIHTIRPAANAGRCKVVRHRDFWPFALHGRGRLKRHAPGLAKRLLKEPAAHLAAVLQRLQPDLVHSLKLPNAYLTQEAIGLASLPQPPRWVHSMWNDIVSNQNYPERLQGLRDFLPRLEYLIADNPRDIHLAQQFGFHGEVLGVFPGGGGYHLAAMRRTIEVPPSKRKVIALKGYQSDEFGQALTALRAIRQCGQRLEGYQIIIHSAVGTYASEYFSDVKLYAREVAQACGIHIEFLPYSPPEAIWDLFAKSRIAIGISKSDGTPNTLLEAISVGAFPIQSNTGGLEQWVESGVTGSLVPSDNVAAIADAINLSLDDDALVDSAAQRNYQLTDETLDYAVVRRKVIDMYEQLLHKPINRAAQ